MQTTHIAIIILSVLDLGIMVLAYWLDRRFYKPVKLSEQGFFSNTTFDEPLNRFILSKGGTLLFSLVFLVFAVLSLKNIY